MKLRVQESGLSARQCAFCKYWYAPTNRAITPLKNRGAWEYDTTIKCNCRLMNVDKVAQTCLMTEQENGIISVNNQLAAIFNYATKYYDLPKNPCNQAGTIGKGKAEEMKFWTQEEFERFLDCVKDKPVSYYGFLTLYWTGCRIGELLALTLEDFNAEEKTLRINKSYQRINGKDVITPPKTEKGKRIITLPDYLVEELKEYVSKLYGIMPEDRLFMTTKAYFEHEMTRGTELSGVKRIRIHDIRHSHASLLISKLGMQPNLVADRLGHEKIQTTLSTYSHLYPDQARKLADELDKLIESGEEE